MAGQEKVRIGYHDILRPEILALVPKDAKKIFDLGCGTGRLGRAIKERQACYVAGIELNSEAAKAATENLDVVITDNLNRFNPTFSKNRYDCLIFADILEHLIAPWAVLQKFTQVLEDKGTVIASVPNIAHPYVISQLQKGVFRYEAAGLLDITHLRFFTKTTLFQMFVRSGLKVTSCKAYPSDDNPVQYHITAVKTEREHKDPIVTILVLTFNGLRYTQECIGSIKERTDVPYKIIVIDNASTDGTVNWLRQETDIQHIENTVNLGFGRGFNIGLECIDTPYFVIANSDIVVTDKWLSRMMNHLDADEKMLLIGPRSNFVSGPQIVTPVPYETQSGLVEYAAGFGKDAQEKVTYFPRVVFFCVLLKSLALQKVGYFDEIFGLGNFEDDDYCMRVKLAGYKAAFDNTVFVHHYGSRSFAENKINYAQLLKENEAKFRRKWKLMEA